MTALTRISSVTQKSFSSLSNLRFQILRKITFLKYHDLYSNILDSQQCSLRISELIQGEKPVMITRFGSTELCCLEDYLKGVYQEKTIAHMHHWSGFFPTTEEALNRYCELFLEAIKLIDILGIWFIESEARIIQKYSEKLPDMANLIDLEPYFHENPWSQHLKNKKVLVIHPFAETILNNYNHQRKLIFENKNVLPDFDIDVIKAVQSIAGNTDGFNSWFDAYNWLRDQIATKDFDVAIIGCGSYGLPLSGFIKSLSKKAIHLGGATQILFGIRGKRWDNRPVYRALYNDSWVRPMMRETPKNHMLVEGGCYW